MKIHPRLAAWIAKRGIEVLSADAHTLTCRQSIGGKTIDFRIELITKKTLTFTRALKRLELGVDAGAWSRISRGQAFVAARIIDTDSLLIADAYDLTKVSRTHDGDGGGRRRTEGGTMTYWAATAMRHVLANGSDVPWDDPIAKAERAAVLRQRELDESAIEEHDGQRAQQPTVFDIFNDE